MKNPSSYQMRNQRESEPKPKIKKRFGFGRRIFIPHGINRHSLIMGFMFEALHSFSQTFWKWNLNPVVQKFLGFSDIR